MNFPQEAILTDTQPAHRRKWRRLRGLGVGVLAVVLFAITMWAALAIYYADLSSGASPRLFVTVLYLIATLSAAVFIRPRRWGIAAVLALFLVVLAWFFSLTPSNQRDWAPEVAQLPSAEISGDHLTVYNLRNFDYRSESDFTSHWVNREYDLSQLKGVDLMLVYWGSKAIAHAMVSYNFEDGQCLCISIETRKEKTESYSALQGFFRQYELYYVVADERDLIRLRTNFRKEDVYLYRTNLTPIQARSTLLSYLDRVNLLKANPDFYNALTSNCATNVVGHAQGGGLNSKMSWEILASGYAARQAYRNGRLDTSLPFEQLEAKSRINDVAIAAGNGPDFSRLIRAGLPNPVNVAGRTPETSSPAATRPVP